MAVGHPRVGGPDSTARHQLPTVAGRLGVQVRRIGRTCPLHNEHELAPDLVRLPAATSAIGGNMADLKELADEAAKELLKAIRDQARKASDLKLLQRLRRRIRSSFRWRPPPNWWTRARRSLFKPGKLPSQRTRNPCGASHVAQLLHCIAHGAPDIASCVSKQNRLRHLSGTAGPASPGLPKQHRPGVGPSFSTPSPRALPNYHLVDSPTDRFNPNNPTRVLFRLARGTSAQRIGSFDPGGIALLSIASHS
jgi:hypothetical protein